MTVEETVFSDGKPTPLNGVLSRTPLTNPKQALIILNSGLLHHVGSCLLSVRLARAAASEGWLVLRADPSGIGDSPARKSDLDHEKQATADTLELVQAMKAQHGVTDVVLSGLCSGAFAAFEAAVADEAVVGIAAIAPFGYRTQRWYLNHYRRRYLSQEAFGRVLRRISGQRRSGPKAYAAEFIEATAAIGWSVPDQESMEKKYRLLLERGVRFLHTFTGGELSYYNYEGQFRESFPALNFGDQLEEIFIPEARHIITEPTFQTLVLDRTHNWLNQHWSTMAEETRTQP